MERFFFIKNNKNVVFIKNCFFFLLFITSVSSNIWVFGPICCPYNIAMVCPFVVLLIYECCAPLLPLQHSYGMPFCSAPNIWVLYPSDINYALLKEVWSSTHLMYFLPQWPLLQALVQAVLQEWASEDRSCLRLPDVRRDGASLPRLHQQRRARSAKIYRQSMHCIIRGTRIILHLYTCHFSIASSVNFWISWKQPS